MWIAFLLVAGAGLSTTIGSLLGLAVKKPGPRFMSFTLGFSAGILILTAFVELLGKAIKTEGVGFFWAHVAFFMGMAGYLLIDFLLPHDYIGQHDHPPGTYDLAGKPSPKDLKRTGLLLALGISVHNFPEGMATLAAALEDLSLGIAIAVAIAIHNIPEGLAISASIYESQGSHRKAFFWSFLSGVSEIAGAGLGALILLPILTERIMGFSLAVVAGTMVLISLDEIIPTAKTLSSEHMPILGVIAGMIVMMLSLWALG
jgi:ZIP family zinc transporter